jgi:predicted ATP-grasp superfamily ATP-dependent carboligase
LRLFLLEYVTGGGLEGSGGPASLIAEARLMVRALAADLARLPDMEITVARDSTIPLGAVPARIETLGPGNPWQAWRELMVASDLVWPIAPETGGMLARLTALALALGKPVLNSRADALAIAGSKRATAHRLAEQGLNVLPCADADEAPPPSETGWIAKPDDGAGCEGLHLLPDARALAAWRTSRPAGDYILQPFLPGDALSLSLLAQEGQAWLLACNRQRIENDGDALHYRGGIVGGAEALRHRLEPIAARVAEALPGLWGYVGIDLIDGPDGPVVIEVNPRLTTSYVALGASLGLNPAALVLALRERRLPELIRPLAPRPVAFAVSDDMFAMAPQ